MNKLGCVTFLKDVSKKLKSRDNPPNIENMLFKTRYNILPTILALYLLPLAALSYYTAKNPSGVRWGVFCISLLLLSVGSLLMFLIIRYWENELTNKGMILESLSTSEREEEVLVPAILNPPDQTEHIQQMEIQVAEAYALKEQTELALQAKQQAWSNLNAEKELLQEHVSALLAELSQIKEATAEKLEQNQIFLNEHQQTITEQRHAIEIKQQHIQQLEDKVRDLTYEIKTLLHLAEKTQIRGQREFVGQKENFLIAPPQPALEESTKPQLSSEEQNHPELHATQQLRHCIDIAQKMTGASHYQNRGGKKSELAIEHYALDLRCLFESLRSETSCAIMIYSQKEGKLIFGNNQIKPLLGWTAEKFIQNFPSIIEESTELWNSTLSQLAYKNECQTELSMRSKGGAQMSIKCFLGVIPTGIFRSNILGLLYKA